jgi:hypothetical protein
MSSPPQIPLYQSEIEQFCDRVEEAFRPDCIILHGSLAQGTYTHHSDIDIIVIGDRLPEDFFERAYELNRLRDGVTPIEVIGYTLIEWEQMRQQLHLTVLESLHWGIPLRGQALFERWQSNLEQWKSLGLRREKMSWSVPPTLQQQIL